MAITVEEFFRRYERANNDFDVDLIATLYADTFLFGNPQGVQVVKKEDFVKVLPRRKDFMKAAGLLSSRVDSVETSEMDSKYLLLKRSCKRSFCTNNADLVTPISITLYPLSTIHDSF